MQLTQGKNEKELLNELEKATGKWKFYARRYKNAASIVEEVQRARESLEQERKRRSKGKVAGGKASSAESEEMLRSRISGQKLQFGRRQQRALAVEGARLFLRSISDE